MKKNIVPYALWITPNFTREMEMGLVPGPWVNQDTLDWNGLLAALEDKFQPEGHGVKMRICNDTIDQVTVHVREASSDPESMRCLDFGAALQKVAKKSKERIIPIRSEWSALHYLGDRSRVPPPIILPLVLEGDSDDIVLFALHIRKTLGIKAASDIMGMVLNTPASEDDMQGHLPPDLMALFEHHFGIGYKSYAIISSLVEIDLSQFY